jgi:hypothetical protein
VLKMDPDYTLTKERVAVLKNKRWIDKRK